jgi:hypothetical protein
MADTCKHCGGECIKNGMTPCADLLKAVQQIDRSKEKAAIDAFIKGGHKKSLNAIFKPTGESNG